MKETLVAYIVLDQVRCEFVVQFCCDTIVKFFAENFDRSIISVERGPTDLHADITQGMNQLT